jgi:DNA-directed RNA polymerase subunit alpha
MILLNLRRIRLTLHGDEPITLTLKKSGVGMVTAGDITAPSQVEILSPEQPICEITNKSTKLEMEIRVEKGLGYVPREVHMKEKMEIGAIAMDAVFTPIRRANYEVENMRVGDRTDYNRLRITLETDGSYSPREALEKSIEIMVHQLKAVIGFQEEHNHGPAVVPAVVAEVKKEEPNQEILKTRIETLDLTSRTLQALETASIRTIGGLVRKKKDDILALDGIGPKGLEEIADMLAGYNLHLEQ